MNIIAVVEGGKIQIDNSPQRSSCEIGYVAMIKKVAQNDIHLDYITTEFKIQSFQKSLGVKLRR